MKRNVLRLTLGLAAVAVVFVGLESQANAFLFGRGGSCGSSGGSWGSNGGSWGGHRSHRSRNSCCQQSSCEEKQDCECKAEEKEDECGCQSSCDNGCGRHRHHRGGCGCNNGCDSGSGCNGKGDDDDAKDAAPPAPEAPKEKTPSA